MANETPKPHMNAMGIIEEKRSEITAKATALHPIKLKIQVPKNSPKRFLIRINEC